MRRRSSWWVLVALAWTCAMSAQQQNNLTPNNPAPIERVTREPLESWPQAGFAVTIIGHDDEPVAGLSLSQLVLSDNGKPPVDARLTPAGGEPQSICFLVDTSGSTYLARAMVRTEILQLVHDLPPADELCAVAYSGQAYLDVPLTSNRSRLTNWVDLLRSSGGSALRDALRGAALELESHARFRSRAIILISDGGENASKSTPHDLDAALHTVGAPVIYTLEHRSAAEVPDKRESNNLLRLTLESGGLDFPIHDDRAVQPALERLLRAMAGRYRLVITPADTTASTEHHLDVQLNKELRKQKMNLTAAEVYDAP